MNTLENSCAFKHFCVSYELLDPLCKACLLCSSFFPEDAEINKRILIYWWIGEELINPSTGCDCEETGHKILASLIEHGFIEEVVKKNRITSRCRVSPYVHRVLVYLAKAARFFDDHEYRRVGAGDGQYVHQHRLCLVKAQNCDIPTSSSSSSASSLQHLRRSSDTYLKQIETLFNVNKCYLDIKLRWFCKMTSVKALYLGKWDSKAVQHIEVKSTKFLAGLKYLGKLRILSLQGVSKIVKLPESIGMINNLRILDLRDCNDMEELPEAVKSLVKLTHLDLSGCHSLARLPKGVALLTDLQVLKGFLIRECRLKDKGSCDFQDLTKLKKLRKLSITTSVRGFPAVEHLKVFNEMVSLCELTIGWRGLYLVETAEELTGTIKDMKPLSGLQKLVLKHIPYETTPAWLVSDQLQSLKKLYIKGSKFLRDLGTRKYHPWNVEVLRLKYLPELSMSWSDMKSLFPNLQYLEKVKCRKLSSSVLNEEGVWVSTP